MGDVLVFEDNRDSPQRFRDLVPIIRQLSVSPTSDLRRCESYFERLRPAVMCFDVSDDAVSRDIRRSDPRFPQFLPD